MSAKFAAALILAAAAMIAVSLSLPPYKDERLFHERYMAMGPGDSDEYWELRDQMLTPKYRLQDYGITLLTFGLTLRFATRTGSVSLRSPRRTVIIAAAVVLPVVSVLGYVFDLLQGYSRGEFPHWADSLGIPLMGVPIIGAILLVWSLLHLLFLMGGYAPASLQYAFSRTANPWLLLTSVVTTLLVLYALAFGQYWYAIPGTLWLYYYLSLAAGRQMAAGQAGYDT